MNHLDTYEIAWEASKVEGISAKALLDHTNGSFKVVRLVPGASYPVHQHPNKTEYAYVLEGALQATIGEEVYLGSVGEFFTFPVGVKHGLHNPGCEETVLLIGAIKE